MTSDSDTDQVSGLTKIGSGSGAGKDHQFNHAQQSVS